MKSEAERIAVLENEVSNMKDIQKEMLTQLEKLKRNQWLQTGAIGVIVFLIEFLFKHEPDSMERDDLVLPAANHQLTVKTQ